MLIGMSDPQQSPVPPYASNAGLPPQPEHPPQTGYPAQTAPTAPPTPTPAPTANHYYQGGAPQQPQAPQYGQQQHSQAPYAQPAYVSAASSATDSNPPGRIGLIIGLAGLVISLLSNVVVQIMIRTSDYALIGLVSGALAVVAFLASLAALIFGIVGLRRAGAPHGLAGIATGLGIAGVVGAGFAFIINAVSSLFYF